MRLAGHASPTKCLWAQLSHQCGRENRRSPVSDVQRHGKRMPGQGCSDCSRQKEWLIVAIDYFSFQGCRTLPGAAAGSRSLSTPLCLTLLCARLASRQCGFFESATTPYSTVFTDNPSKKISVSGNYLLPRRGRRSRTMCKLLLANNATLIEQVEMTPQLCTLTGR